MVCERIYTPYTLPIHADRSPTIGKSTAVKEDELFSRFIQHTETHSYADRKEAEKRFGSTAKHVKNKMVFYTVHLASTPLVNVGQ